MTASPPSSMTEEPLVQQARRLARKLPAHDPCRVCLEQCAVEIERRLEEDEAAWAREALSALPLIQQIAAAKTFSELRALMDRAETGEEFAAICAREVELENEHGPEVDPMANVEFPFARNH